MSEKANNPAHWVLGVALLLIGVFVIAAMVLVNSQATTTEVDITNSAPVVDSVFLSDTTAEGVNDWTMGSGQTSGLLTPTANDTTTVYVNGVVSDANGEDDIASVLGGIRQDNVLLTSCDEVGELDYNTCIVNTSCTLDTSVGTALEAGYDCSITVQYYTDGTDSSTNSTRYWNAFAQVTDDSAATDDSTAAFEMGAVLSLTLSPSSSLDFGSGALGDELSVTQTVTQTGNDEATLEVNGDENAAAGTQMFDCDGGGDITVDQVAWTLNSEDGFGDATALTNSSADAVNLTYRTDDSTALTDDLYWHLEIPSTGVAGTCTGSLTQTVSAQ